MGLGAGTGEDVADALGEERGDADGAGDPCWAWLLGLPPGAQEAATATSASSTPALLGAETWSSVPINGPNAILRTPLRFRYHPRSEAGRRPHPQDRPKGVHVADGPGCPFCFIW